MEERLGDTAKDEKLLQEGSVQELRPPSVCMCTVASGSSIVEPGKPLRNPRAEGSNQGLLATRRTLASVVLAWPL